MAFYKHIIAAVAALSLTGVAFAANDQAQQPGGQDTQAIQIADQSSTTTTTTTTTEEVKINVNNATIKQLTKIKGLNSMRAKAIVSYRKKHGEFKSLDDLRQVKGFKKMDEDTLKNIQDQLTLS